MTRSSAQLWRKEEDIPPQHFTVTPIKTEDDIRATHSIMIQLRPQYKDQNLYVVQVQRQMEQQGYKLIAAYSGVDMVGVAGYVTGEKLGWGKFLYVDDLVTDKDNRSRGVGRTMISWLHAHGRELGLASFHMPSENRIGPPRFIIPRRHWGNYYGNTSTTDFVAQTHRGIHQADIDYPDL